LEISKREIEGCIKSRAKELREEFEEVYSISKREGRKRRGRKKLARHPAIIHFEYSLRETALAKGRRTNLGREGAESLPRCSGTSWNI
jgi:hypothetical protein